MSTGLDIDEDFDTGLADDPDTSNASEALGARHRRRFGYSTEGAQENDADIAAKGRKPLHSYDGPRRQHNMGESRNLSFNHSVSLHHAIKIGK